MGFVGSELYLPWTNPRWGKEGVLLKVILVGEPPGLLEEA
jgi:hypothetical protein